MATPLNTILTWFETGDVPTQEQFQQTFSAFRHKDALIPFNDVQGLETALQGTVSSESWNTFQENYRNTLANLAKIDASNLTDAQKVSWKQALGVQLIATVDSSLESSDGNVFNKKQITDIVDLLHEKIDGISTQVRPETITSIGDPILNGPALTIIYNNEALQMQRKTVDLTPFKNGILEAVNSGYKGELKISDPLPTIAGMYRLLDIGNYTQLTPAVDSNGNSITIIALSTKLNQAYYDGSVWMNKSIDMPEPLPAGNVSLGEVKAVNGDKVYKAVQPINDTFFDTIGVPASPNLANPAYRFPGRLISTGNDVGITAAAGWDVWMVPVSELKNYTASNWLTARDEIAFFSGNIPTTLTTPVFNTGLIKSGHINYVLGINKGTTITFQPLAGSGFVAFNVANASEPDSVFASFQLEEGTTPTPYQPFNPVDTSYKVLKSDFKQKGKIKEIKKSGNLVYIRTDFNTTYDLVRTINLYGSSNGGSLLTSSILIGKSESISAPGTVFHLINDSIPPFQINTKESGYSNLGGNHGTPVLEPTAPAHGKTSADLGSKWTDGNGWNWYLVEIVNSDKLRFVFEPKNVNGFDIIRLGAASPLMHLSGASNTANIIFTIGANDIYEFKPCINSAVVKLYIDGKEITADGTYVGDSVKIVDTHNVVDPTQPNLTAPYSPQYNGTLVNNSIEYTFHPNHVITVDNPADWRKNTSVRNQGLIQPQCLTKGSYSTLMVYAMNLNAMSGNNFKSGFDLTALSTTLIPTSADFTESTKAVQQMSQLLFSGSNPVIGGGFGYNPLVGLGKQSELLQNSSHFELRGDTKKCYPRGFTRASGTNILRGIGYFAYWDATINPKLSADYYVPFGRSDLYFLNIRVAMTKEKVKLAKELQLREFSIVNSSSGINIHTLDSSTSEGLIISGAIGDWAVLKFD